MVAFLWHDQQPPVPKDGEKLVPSHPELLLQEVAEFAGAQARHAQADLLHQLHGPVGQSLLFQGPCLPLIVGLPAVAKQFAGQREAYLPLLAELLFVLLRFGGFACCVQAFDLSFALGWGGWLAGFALAWTAGLVVPGAPGGLGVFEAVLLLRLAAAVPEAPLLAVAISYRLVTSLADLLAAGSARLDQRRSGSAP